MSREIPPTSPPTTNKIKATMLNAFARSRPLMARYDVAPHLTKWWKGVRPDDGQVSYYYYICFIREGFIGYCLCDQIVILFIFVW